MFKLKQIISKLKKKVKMLDYKRTIKCLAEKSPAENNNKKVIRKLFRIQFGTIFRMCVHAS